MRVAVERPGVGGETETAMRQPDLFFARMRRPRGSLVVLPSMALRRTTRGPAPKANEPDTRSTGRPPSVRLVRWWMPRTTACVLSAKSTSGCRSRRASALLCESPLATATTGSMIMRLTSPISPQTAMGIPCPRRIEAARFAVLFNPLIKEPGTVAAGGHETGQERVVDCVLTAPNEDVSG